MSKDHQRETRLVHAGRNANAFGGTVNPPIQRASTLLIDDVSKLYSGKKSHYGRLGMMAHDALIEGLCELEGAKYAQLAVNGLNACALALGALTSAGDHVIASDSIYGPTRNFCKSYLARMGVEVSFIHPRMADLSEHIQPNTRVLFLEMPGSLTFELHDLNSVTEIARAHNVTTVLDNTWGAGIFLRPLEHGVDVSLQALTKYVIGHSDGFGGAVMTNSAKLGCQIERTAKDWGLSMSPDDAYLAQRGLRSIALRMQSQGTNALKIAEWLEAQPLAEHVLHPALPSHPDHAIWQKYFTGACGLFGFCLKPVSEDALNTFFQELTLFGFGFSWGGFESLMIPCDPQLDREASPEWQTGTHGHLIRISIGLEDPEDLIADLERALNKASQ